MQFNQLILYKQKKWRIPFIIMGVLLCMSCIAYLSVGDIKLSLLSPLNDFQQQVIVNLRLPRLLAAILLGASLAVSGATLQVLLGNPLAEPGVLGISGGASLAMVIALFFFPFLMTPYGAMFVAISGSLIFTLIIVMMAKAMRLTTARLLLIGVALGILSGALVTWAFYFSDNLNLRILMYWLMGSISGVTWTQISLGLVMLPGIIWLCSKTKFLDLLMVGESHAQQLGLDVHKLRWKLILLVSVLVGGSVAIGGVISFVGLVIPHLIRLLFGSENKYLIPMSALCGATLLVVADLLARVSLPSAELPLGVMTTSIGAPVFIWMLLRNYDRH
ncbi:MULTISPECIES: vitamin B12 ABC transporter permease BtuC [Vibrio]|uniref:Vitamin B12 ABC transporter permease BtuC n=1 Tax=Vibrio casei TaxID=673372 RepID=A0A368LP78_9VIBR|nr:MULTISPECIES: vitamin B12 ABC transporter permease BtuC [Vibrio]RCS73293.1 vitamin B12 ABC transporter permease BtuC [Vibrio casei]SJN18149.1 Vitamin B12 ABC transporter, permease component BtuC [Vibrio casei]HBV75764.1 vitamin B12 ABC transporter permease BtuC [Vibrio sp.]